MILEIVATDLLIILSRFVYFCLICLHFCLLLLSLFTFFVYFQTLLLSRRTSSMTSNPPTHHNLLDKIKHRLLTMDLLNQMDKAKELTHFALTHQAISKEDKE